MALTDKMYPILITFDVEEILVLCTVIETFRNATEIEAPFELRRRIEGILQKMIREMEYQVEGD